MSFRLRAHGPAALALALGLTAPMAAHAAAARAAAPVARPYVASDWKEIDPQNLLVIDTNKGRIIVELVPVFAPDHVERIKMLTRMGYYDGLKFFRVIDDFMAQTGDKANTGAGESGFPTLPGAFTFRRGADTSYVGVNNGAGQSVGFIGPSPVASQPDDLMGLTADGRVKAWGLFCAGVAGMARTSQPDSASAQFFLIRQTSNALNTQYTPWGRVVVGLGVLRAITVGEPPADPDVMDKVRIAADMPAAERPSVWRIDTAGATFRANLAAAVAARGADFTPCDLDVPGEVRTK